MWIAWIGVHGYSGKSRAELRGIPAVPRLVVSNPPDDPPPPPDHLGEPEQAIWRDVIADWKGSRVSFAVLASGLEAHQRAREARGIIDNEGMTVTFEQAIILESLGTSISIAGFLIPGSLGVQEAGYVLIGRLLGLPIQFSLSLSLVKRIPDLLLGLLGVLTWHAFETHNLLLPEGGGARRSMGSNGGAEQSKKEVR